MVSFCRSALRLRGFTAALAVAAFPLLIAAPAGAAPRPGNAASGVYYEIFVRSFVDSNPSPTYHGYDVTHYGSLTVTVQGHSGAILEQ